MVASTSDENRLELRISRRALVVAVSGNAIVRDEIRHALTSFYRVAVFDDGDLALRELIRSPPCAILVDETAPPSGGVALVGRIRALAPLAKTPIIFATGRARVTLDQDVRQFGADAALIKPFWRSALIRTISGLVNRSIERRWEALPEAPRDCLRRTVTLFNGMADLIDAQQPLQYQDVTEACAPLLSMVAASDYKTMLAAVRDHDNYSYVHSMRIATFLSLFGNAIGLKGDDLTTLACGGLLHDVGKMYIPHEILNKPGTLMADEMTVMRSHVDHTLAYLGKCPGLPRGIMTIAGQHHEKLDGSGYPFGLKSHEINDLARMAAIVDVFGALTDRRIYKPPMDAEAALAIMTERMTRHLDQDLLTLFRDMLLDAARTLPHPHSSP